MKSLEEQQRIREKHQHLIKNSKRITRQRIDVKLLGSIQVAKAESKIYFERVALMHTPLTDQYFFVLYNKSLPDGLSLLDESFRNDDYVVKDISDGDAEIVMNAIGYYEEYKHYHINSYSTLILYCLMQGLDLVEKKFINI